MKKIFFTFLLFTLSFPAFCQPTVTSIPSMKPIAIAAIQGYFCKGESQLLVGDGGALYSNLQWRDLSTNTLLSTTDTVDLNSPWITVNPVTGLFWIRLNYITIATGIPASSTFQILKSDPGMVDIGPDTIFKCDYQTVDVISTTGSDTLYWYKWGGLSNKETAYGARDSVANIINTGTLRLQRGRFFLGDSLQCYARDTIEISSNQITLDLGKKTDTVCLGGNLNITTQIGSDLSGDTSDVSFGWIDKSTGTTTPGRTSNITGDSLGIKKYCAIAQNNNTGCRDTFDIDVTTIAPPNVEAVLGPDTVVDALITSSIDLDATMPNAGSYTYQWRWVTGSQSLGTNPVHTVFSTGNGQYSGTYQATVTDQSTGCVGVGEINVTFDFGANIIYVPNAFAPSITSASLTEMTEDTRFKVFGINIIKINLQVYNQWGDLVYKTDDVAEAMTNGWDGGNYPAGVFTYVVEGEFIDGETFEKTGGVTLVR